MNREIIDYIIKYFSELMTDHEKLALKYHMYTSKSSENAKLRRIMTERGWINSDPEIMDLLKKDMKILNIIQ